MARPHAEKDNKNAALNRNTIEADKLAEKAAEN